MPYTHRKDKWLQSNGSPLILDSVRRKEREKPSPCLPSSHGFIESSHTGSSYENTCPKNSVKPNSETTPAARWSINQNQVYFTTYPHLCIWQWRCFFVICCVAAPIQPRLRQQEQKWKAELAADETQPPSSTTAVALQVPWYLSLRLHVYLRPGSTTESYRL